MIGRSHGRLIAIWLPIPINRSPCAYERPIWPIFWPICPRRDVTALDDASRPADMNLPGFRFHALAGREKGRYAVNASGNWRITVGWMDGDAIDVDLEDYH